MGSTRNSKNRLKIEELEEEGLLDKNKIETCIRRLEEVLASSNMTVPEFLIAFGNLAYKMGASFRRNLYEPKFRSEPPDLDNLNKLYYTKPTVDVSLMITGLGIMSWVESLVKSEK